MNILILSAGTRNKIVQYFKNTIGDNGNVIVTDMSLLSSAIYDADKYYIVPAITDDKYIDIILEICEKEKVNGVLSLIDPELSLLAKNQERFSAINTTIIGSSLELCNMSLDKYQMYLWLKKNNFKCAKSYVDIKKFIEDLNDKKIVLPVFMKPVKGSASIEITKCSDIEEIKYLKSIDYNLMIQEYLDGEEIGADVYIDIISGKVVSIFTKKKIKMRAGETDKAISFKDEKLFELINDFVTKCGYRGQIDIDIFEIGGEYYISEVNPRFGGGYPHAYECGCDHMKLIVNNLNGIENKVNIGKYQENICMIKYNEVKIRKV
ncbi:MAG: ATP-grasp domain-containing protein [Clostridium sp.]|nr:ATP-grasp domain-containing protein [Clostridium sp.]